MPPAEILAVLAAAVLIGALVQGVVGLGLGLVGAPAITLLAPELMPGTILFLACVLPFFTLAREWSATDWWGLRWAFIGRLPATAGGAWVVSVVSDRALAVMVGTVVLTAVVLTVRTVRLPMRPSVLVGAGVISGVTGTATSIGGPPLALVYQRALGSQVRATLAMYFVIGAAASLVGLAVAGDLTVDQGWAALWLAVPMVLGFGLSGPVRRRVDGGGIRAGVLVVCAMSAIALLLRGIAG